MKVLIVAFVIGVVAADVSHLAAPSRSYLPPNVGAQQGFSQFGGGAGQHFGGGAGQQFGGRIGQQQLPSNQYLAPRGGSGFDVNSQSGFGGGQIRTSQYSGLNQGQSPYGSSSLGSSSFGSQTYQRGGNAYQSQGQFQTSRFGQSNDLIPGHSLSEDGYRYRSPTY